MNNGGPAFPTLWTNESATNAAAPDGQTVGAFGEVRLMGMSLRDYFAVHAPAEYLGVVALAIQEAGDRTTAVATIMASAAFHYADAMLAAREKT